MGKLIILRGNSGSGKTTIAKVLHKKLNNSILISQDVVRRDILNEKDAPNCETKALILHMMEYAVKCDKNVILEGIFRVDYYEDMLEQAIHMFDSVHGYYFDLSLEETIKRYQTRKESREFGEDKLRDWFKEKNYLTILEEAKISEEMSQETIIEIMLEQC